MADSRSEDEREETFDMDGPPPDSESKRKSHNAQEQKRRTELSGGYGALRSAVRKRHPKAKLTTDKMLSLASQDILFLHNKRNLLKKLSEEMRAMEEELRREQVGSVPDNLDAQSCSTSSATTDSPKTEKKA